MSAVLSCKGRVDTGTRCEMGGMEGRRMEGGSDVRCIEDTKDHFERIYWRDNHCEKKSSTYETGVSLHRIALLCTDIFQNESAWIYILARKTSVSSTTFWALCIH